MKKRPARKQNRHIQHAAVKKDGAVIVLRRFFMLTACLGLFIFAIALFNRHAFSQAVAGAAITRGLFVQTTVALPHIPGAVMYNIYYKPDSNAQFVNAVRSIPSNISNYTISYLKKGVSYQYKISAVNTRGAEFWWSASLNVTDLQSM